MQSRIMVYSKILRPETELKTRRFLKKVYLVFSFSLFYMAFLAGSPLASKREIAMFKDSRTCVVFKNGIHFYNAYIRDAVQKYWKSTNYEFIDQNEFEKRRTDSKYSFIVLMDESYNKDPAGIAYTYINLVLGDTSGVLNKMPELCSLPLSFAGDSEVYYEYVIPAIVKFMQIHVNDLENDRLPIFLNGLKYYNKIGFKDKVLLLNKGKLVSNVDTPEEIELVYPYYVKLLTPDEIKNELTDCPPNTLFNFHVGPPPDAGAGKCFEMIFDCEGNLFYFNKRSVTNHNGDGFNSNDFKKIR